MIDEKNRLEKIIPIIRERAKVKSDKFTKILPLNNMVQPYLSQIKEEEKKRKAQEELERVMGAVWPATFLPFFEMQEMSELAKEGVKNMLQAMGYSPKIDKTFKGFSGNKYALSVVASTKERLIIVDQMMMSSELLLPWFKAQMPKTFEEYKVTIADFFKYIDVSMGLKKPSIYWLHDYKISSYLASNLGFSLKRMMKEILNAMADVEGIPREEIEKQMLTDEDFGRFMNTFDTSMSEMFGTLGKAIQKLSTKQPSPFAFNVKRTANRFCIPIITTQLLDMLEAAMLNPKSPSDSRTLKGYSFELGLLDFLNPPWPDYVLELAWRQKQPHFEKLAKMIEASEIVGHNASSIKELAVNPKKLKVDPADGIEVLANSDLVTVKAKETYKITDKGREYIKEVHKRPKKHALRKVYDSLREHVAINIPPFTIKGKKNNEDKE
jgi:hypothetical protein